MKYNIPTYFMLCGVARDDHGHDFQSLGAATQAVDADDVGTLIVHRLHELRHVKQSVRKVLYNITFTHYL